MTSDRPQITPQERALIDAHIAKHGVTVCPTGAMATAQEYVTDAYGALRNKNGSAVLREGNGAFFRNKARAARLRKAEART